MRGLRVCLVQKPSNAGKRCLVQAYLPQSRHSLQWVQHSLLCWPFKHPSNRTRHIGEDGWFRPNLCHPGSRLRYFRCECKLLYVIAGHLNKSYDSSIGYSRIAADNGVSLFFSEDMLRFSESFGRNSCRSHIYRHWTGQ